MYERELFAHDRFLGQVDIGGLPYTKVARSIELLATYVLPAIRGSGVNRLLATNIPGGWRLADKVIKAQVFMTDPKNFAAFDEVWKNSSTIPQPHDRWDHWLAGEGLLVEVDLVATCVVQYGGRHGRTATH